MEYTSFYGGRRGASFVIVKSYRCIQEPDPTDKNFNNIIRIDLGYQDMEKAISASDRTKWLEEHCMVYCFSKGGNYKTVNYDEYVIIDALDRNDIDNGKVYRRGYDYNNEVGGAEYVGQIVGPTGPAPQVEMKTYKEVQDEYGERGPIDPETGDEYRKSEGAYAPTENLIPGQYYDEAGIEKFNDEIKWITCSIRDAHSHQSTVHVGFIFPYKVTQWTANSVSPYYHRSDAVNQEMENWDETGDTTTFYNDKLVTRVDDLSHPFFERWDFKVPKGIKGDTFENLRVTTVAECNEQHPGWLQQYAGMDDDQVTEAIKKERKILVYDYYHYDRDKGGDPVSIYLGDYNEITNVDVAEDGTLTIDYSHNDEDVWERIFKWVKSISLNKETGKFEIVYNQDIDSKGVPTKYETSLTWAKSVSFDEEGTVTIDYTDEPDTVYTKLVKWINQTTLDPETGKFTVIYNHETDKEGTPTKYEQDLRWVKEVTITDEGTITFDYTNGPDTVYENMFKWIKSVTLDTETGHLEVIYNYDEKDGEPTKYETDLRWVKDIEFQDNGSVNLQYTTNTDPGLEYDRLIKWIKDVSLDTETGRLTVKYNYDETPDGEPTIYEQDLRWVKDIEFKEDGSVNLKYTTNTDEGLEYDRLIKWIDSVTINEDGHLVVTYNHLEDAEGNPTTYETDLRYINNINVANDGTVTLKYTTGPDVTLDNKIKWINQTTLSPTGTLTIVYNDGTEDVFDKKLKWIEDIIFTDEGHLSIYYNNGTPSLEKDIIWITDVEVQTGETEGLGNQKVKVTFNNGTSKEIGMPLNYIMKTAIDDRYHLLALYSDPARREEVKNSKQNATWEDRDDWHDLGYIGNGTGVGAVAGKADDEGVAAVAENMPPYSVWFIIED